MTDFERFKVMCAKQKRAKEVKKSLKKCLDVMNFIGF